MQYSSVRHDAVLGVFLFPWYQLNTLPGVAPVASDDKKTFEILILQMFSLLGGLASHADSQVQCSRVELSRILPTLEWRLCPLQSLQ